MNTKHDLTAWLVATVLAVLLGAYVVKNFIGVPLTEMVQQTGELIAGTSK